MLAADGPNLQSFADFLDGTSATVRRVEISIDETPNGPFLVIAPPEVEKIYWSLSDIRAVPDQAARDTTILALAGDAVSRLVVTDTETRAIIAARCKNLKKRPSVENKRRLLGWSIGALASVALIVFVLVPITADQLAEYLPPGGEKALGDATFEQIRTALSDSDILPVTICNNPVGVDALQEMQTRLAADIDLPYPLIVHVS